MLTIKDIKARIQEIAICAHDYEVAHSKEDELRRDVLQAIADGTCKDPARAAALALTTSEIEFPRHCA